MADYTTTGLIANVKRRGAIPTSQQTFQTADFLQVLNDEMRNTVVSDIESAEEDYFLTYASLAVVAGTDAYAIASNAVSAAIRDVVRVVDGVEIPVTRLTHEQVTQNPYLEGFWIRGNKLVFYPVPSQADTVRVYYYRRPAELVATASCALITAVGATTVDVVSVPSTWVIGTSVDATAATPHFDVIGESIAITNIASTTITLAVPTGLAVGDYLAPAGQSPVPQIPLEAHALLAQATAAECLRIMGSMDAFQAAQAKYEDLKAKFLLTVEPRVDDAVKKVASQKGIFYYSGG